MKSAIFAIGLLSLVVSVCAQEMPNESSKLLYPIPVLPDSMTYEEFVTMNRELNWKRLMIASFVPGYIHYYAHHEKWAYTIAAVRTVGTALSFSGIFREWRKTKQLDLGVLDEMDTNFYLFVGGLFLNMAGYAFDVAHGDWLIERERMQIQFKFRKRESSSALGLFDGTVPTLVVSLKIKP